MSAPLVARHLQILVAGACLLLAGTLLAPSADGQQAGRSERRASTNPTGAASGSEANRRGHLKLSLSTTANGRIKVTWVRPGRVSQFRRFVVQVSPTRTMETRVRSYRVTRRRQSVIVSRAAGATPASGNYSFVNVVAVRTNGKRGGSSTKWIQAPITSPCRASAGNQVAVAAFNVRTWSADPAPSAQLSWTRRGDNVISEILRSGARAIAIQEASGKANVGFGPSTQQRWILDRLNAADPGARWVDALDDLAYRPPRGRTPGHVGTRVFYDANKYVELASGLSRIVDRDVEKDSLVPWARLRSVSGTQAPFVLTSNHLTLGAPRSRKDWTARGRQAVQTIAIHRELQSRFGDQVILAGDLNSTANTRPYNNVQHLLMNAGFYDTYASATIVGGQYPTTSLSKFPLYRTPLRRDYIMTLGPTKGSCGYRNQAYHRPSQVASDHLLQLARVPLPAVQSN